MNFPHEWIPNCKTPIPRFSQAWIAALASCAGLVGSEGVYAQGAAAGEARSEPFVVAVREVPPFAMRDSAGNWEGLSIDLWQDVADVLDLEFEWREATLGESIELLRAGDADAAVAAVSVTGQREAFIDFSHPYYVTGLSPASADDGSSAWLATLRGFFSIEFLSAVGSLAIVLLAAGFCIWLFERKANAEEFGGGDLKRGLGDGFWWSAVTMTTVGYGDKSPRTLGGRVVALIWMFLSLIIIASFTASIAVALTANELADNALRERPLSEMTVGVLAGSVAEEYATNRGVLTRRYESVAAAVDALGAGRVNTVIHDAPILRYEVRAADLDIEVSDRILVRDDYAFAFPESSPIRNDVNLALLSIRFEPVWQSIGARYLGDLDSAVN